MSPLLIAQLLATFGPSAISLIARLQELWTKPALTPDEVGSILRLARKSYDEYINEAAAKS